MITLPGPAFIGLPNKGDVRTPLYDLSCVLLNKLLTFALNDNFGPGAELPDWGEIAVGPPGPLTKTGGAPGSGPAGPADPPAVSGLFNTIVFVKLILTL